MPRSITINPAVNPTKLSMAERQLAIAVIQSLRESLVRERRVAQNSYFVRQRGWSLEQERDLLTRVTRSALNQFSGRQKTENGAFTLVFAGEPQDEDMDYVLNSLGVKGT